LNAQGFCSRVEGTRTSVKVKTFTEEGGVLFCGDIYKRVAIL